MANLVTERFIECHNKLREDKKVVSSRQFALSIDTAPQRLNQVLKGKRDATVKNVMALVETYNVNSEYLLAGYGPMFKEDIEILEQREDKIIYVPIAAHAGYLDQFNEEVSNNDLLAFSVPGYQPTYGEHRCFDIAGDSMEPTLFSGDKIICSLVPSDYNYNSLRDNYVYVVIAQGDIVVKRVENNIKNDGSIKMMSDNSFYNSYSIDANDITEIWSVKLKISPFMPNPANMRNAFHEEINSLKETISVQADSLTMMNKSLESLIKKNR
ncbi:MAG: S24 family peptidase [Saprospiraceae bacterium]